MSDLPFILYIPDIALEKIFLFLSYDEIAKNRLVSQGPLNGFTLFPMHVKDSQISLVLQY